MRVRVLGPLQVMRGTAMATPSAPKLRRLLALLAVNADGGVRTDQIIEELWEDRPPPSAMTTLQTYVYQLRKLLALSAQTGGPGTPDVRGTGANGAARAAEAAAVPALRTSPGGYVLVLPAAALDAHEFERLAERGRAHLVADRREEATETLRAALQLWRGPVLSDVGAGPVLRAIAVRLEEIRKRALEQRIDAELALGYHHELISELTGLVAEQPTHEGFQAKLILSLYRAGRRSDALRVYQQARATLSHDLGLEPSSELQRLHRAVLVADATLDAPSRTRARIRIDRVGPPSQLPADVSPIVGRGRAVDQVRRVLVPAHRSAPPVVLVCGLPGSGKSAFCVHAAHAVRANYPDGQLFVELVDPTGAQVHTSTALGYFLRAAGIPDDHVPASLEERTRLFRSWTADRRVLVVLDDAISIDQLRSLAPTGAGCAALVACRRRLSGPSITSTVVLEPLDARDAAAMLTELLGDRRVSDDPDAVRALIEVCAGSPLALRTAATKLLLRPHWPVRRIVAQACPAGQRTCAAPAAGLGSAEGLGMHLSVCRTYRLMPPTVRATFRIVAGQPAQTVTATTAARALGVAAGYAEALLEDLVEFQLAEVEPGHDKPDHGEPGSSEPNQEEPNQEETDGAFRYRIQPLLRVCARELDAMLDTAQDAAVPTQATGADRPTDPCTPVIPETARLLCRHAD